MPAFLTPNGKNRIVVDRIITLGGGRSVCELQGQFFSMNGDFLDDMELVALMPEPFKTRATKFVEAYKAAKVKETSDDTVMESLGEEEPPKHTISPELQRVLDVRTSEERAQENAG
jgi:hypothetical protein